MGGIWFVKRAATGNIVIPGCIATGATRADAERNISEAICFHIEGLLAEGLDVPESKTESGTIVLN